MDLLLTSNSDLIEDLVVEEPFSNSDHMSLNFNINFLLPRISYEPRKIYLYSKGDYESMNQEISLTPWNDFFRGKSVNQKWDIFKFVKKSMEKKLKQRGLHIDKVKYESAKSDYKDKLCNAKAKYEGELVDALPTNPKKFYNYTRSFISSSSTIDSLVVDGTKVYDDSVKAKALNDFFGSVLVKETPLNHSLPIYDDKPSETLRFKRFTVSEVAKKMKSLKANKGSDPDGIHVNVLRSTPAFAEPLCELFNDSVFLWHIATRLEGWKHNSLTQEGIKTYL